MKQNPPVRISDSVWWLGSSSTEDFLQANAYAVSTASGILLIDPGPLWAFTEVRESLRRATGRDLPSAVAVTSQNPDSCASISRWEEAGFSGPIVCHWRSWVNLGAYGFFSKTEGIHQTRKSRLIDLGEIQFIPAPVFNTYGSLFIFDEASKTFFSGPYCGSIGRTFPLYAGEGQKTGILRSFIMNLSRDVDVETVLASIERFSPLAVCPHHGSIITANRTVLFDQVRKLNSSDKADELRMFLLAGGIDPESSEKNAIMQDLKKENERLQEALVLGTDESLRDPLTGLYTRKYIDAYLSVFLSSSPNGAIASLHLDALRALAVDVGGEEAERAMQSFARTVLALRPDDFLVFRGTGASLVLLSPSEDAMLPFISRLQEEISASSAFLKSSTVSAAVAYCSEARTPAAISTILARRSDALETMGAGSICFHTPDALSRSPGPILVVEPDRTLSKLVTEYLTTRRHTVLVCHDGEEAMRLMDSRQPAVIICEQHVPQYDGYLLHAYAMRAVTLVKPRFILISPHKSEEDVARSCAAGISHYLKKPLMLAELEGLASLLLEEAYAFWN